MNPAAARLARLSKSVENALGGAQKTPRQLLLSFSSVLMFAASRRRPAPSQGPPSVLSGNSVPQELFQQSGDARTPNRCPVRTGPPLSRTRIVSRCIITEVSDCERGKV
jgi:hypothetical protein